VGKSVHVFLSRRGLLVGLDVEVDEQEQVRGKKTAAEQSSSLRSRAIADSRKLVREIRRDVVVITWMTVSLVIAGGGEQN
jgi:hypothetical protein